jgi:hypothetical protein
MERQVIPKIAFDEPDIGPPQPYVFDRVVHELPTAVVGYIIPAFKHFLRNP